MGDVAVRLRRASLRPGPATADGFARLRLRRQTPTLRVGGVVQLRTWHMTPRALPLGEECYTLTDGAEIVSGDHGAGPKDWVGDPEW